MKTKLIVTLLSIFYYSASIAQNTPTYPQPKEGFKRVDLIFPRIENSNQYKVEVRFGMQMELYPCSKAGFSFISDALIKDYGIKDGRFPYYDLTTNQAEVFEGFMDENCKKEQKIKRKIVSDNSLLLKYNSYYPTPFYIPENYTLEYRLWNTVTDEFTTVKMK
ncbi:MAG: ecotin family protein [Myroides sp.]|nr:ecotin family protein [Myroides sp.]